MNKPFKKITLSEKKERKKERKERKQHFLVKKQNNTKHIYKNRKVERG